MKNVSIMTAAVCLSAIVLFTSCDVNIRTKDYRDSEKWGKVSADTTTSNSLTTSWSMPLLMWFSPRATS